MEYTFLGNTGVKVSKICLGCMSYGTPGWPAAPWVLDEEASGDHFRVAVEQGINFFDTADSYSDGRSEEITGRWLREYACRDEIVIATKVYGGPDRPNMRGLSRKHIQQACEGSLKRLRVDCIDLYQIHRLDPYTPLEEVLAAMDLLVRQGKVRYIGASSMYAWQFMKALSISEKRGFEKFVSMQDLYNLLYREEEREMLALCASEKISVIPWSPLARGILAGKVGDEAERTKRTESDSIRALFLRSPSTPTIVGEVIGIAAERGVTPAQISLAWLLSKDVITAPIVGATRIAQIVEAAEAVTIRLSDTEIQRLEAPYTPKPSLGITPPFITPQPGTVHDRG